MKVALLHDWLTGFRGGERVLEALAELYPDAPIYTLIHKKGSTSPILESRRIITSFLDRIPGIHENYRKFLPLMPLAAEKLYIDQDVDLLISSSHCVIKGVRKPESAKHLCYIHSPMRYIYDQFDSYFGSSSLPIRLGAHACRPYLEFWDKQSSHNVDLFIANSSFVAERVKQFYHRKALVLNPFVDLKDFAPFQDSPPKKENFFLMVSAFAPNKRLDLAIEAFKILGSEYRLKIVGSGSEEDTQRLKAMAGNNVEFLGNRSRAEIIDLFFKAKAFVFPGIEDFGITPLESLAAGTPVIAFKAAGVLDSLNRQTAQFFEAQSVDDIVSAIQNFKPSSFERSLLYQRAEDFSKESFLNGFQRIVSSMT